MSETTTVKVITPKCPHCGEAIEMEVDAEGYRRWALEGWLIQKALPDMTVAEREMLMTGFHTKCWDEVFADQED